MSYLSLLHTNSTSSDNPSLEVEETNTKSLFLKINFCFNIIDIPKKLVYEMSISLGFLNFAKKKKKKKFGKNDQI